jgi:hypothetical protein
VTHSNGNTFALELVRLAGDVLLQQQHQCVDFGGGTLPVLLREREQRENLDSGGQ